jgi:type IV pilus assembly protein PilA
MMKFSEQKKRKSLLKNESSRTGIRMRDASGFTRTPSFSVRKGMDILHAKSRNFLQYFINTKKLGVTLSYKGGFTLLEILLVVAAIAILAGIVILAINPAKQLGDTRNAQRKVDVSTISNGIYQYMISNGMAPASILSTSTVAFTACSQISASSSYEICKTGLSGTGCGPRTDLSVLTANSSFLVEIPVDPNPIGGATASGTGYYILKNGNNRFVVCTPSAENNTSIIITK